MTESAPKLKVSLCLDTEEYEADLKRAEQTAIEFAEKIGNLLEVRLSESSEVSRKLDRIIRALESIDSGANISVLK